MRIFSRPFARAFFAGTLAFAAVGGAFAADLPQVFVLGTLYKRHETVPAYDVKAVARIIEAIRPDVVVLDVNPTELAERKVFPGKVEYTQAIFPYLEKNKTKAYAGEAAEPEFSRIVQAVIKAREDQKKANPDGAAAMDAYRKATFEALTSRWKSPADVNGAASERVVAGMKSYEAWMIGPVEEETSHRWDAVSTEMVLRAVKENPGKRVLQITGIENLPLVRANLRASGAVELVDMEAWLRANVR